VVWGCAKAGAVYFHASVAAYHYVAAPPATGESDAHGAIMATDAAGEPGPAPQPGATRLDAP
jgi:hypothetical protein